MNPAIIGAAAVAAYMMIKGDKKEADLPKGSVMPPDPFPPILPPIEGGEGHEINSGITPVMKSIPRKTDTSSPVINSVFKDMMTYLFGEFIDNMDGDVFVMMEYSKLNNDMKFWANDALGIMYGNCGVVFPSIVGDGYYIPFGIDDISKGIQVFTNGSRTVRGTWGNGIITYANGNTDKLGNSDKVYIDKYKRLMDNKTAKLTLDDGSNYTVNDLVWMHSTNVIESLNAFLKNRYNGILANVLKDIAASERADWYPFLILQQAFAVSMQYRAYPAPEGDGIGLSGYELLDWDNASGFNTAAMNSVMKHAFNRWAGVFAFGEFFNYLKKQIGNINGTQQRLAAVRKIMDEFFEDYDYGTQPKLQDLYDGRIAV